MYRGTWFTSLVSIMEVTALRKEAKDANATASGRGDGDAVLTLFSSGARDDLALLARMPGPWGLE